MPFVYRLHGNGDNQENCLFQGIKACFKTSDSVRDQRPSSGWQQTDRLSPGSLPQLEHGWDLSPPGTRATCPDPTQLQSCCWVPGRSRASPDTPVRVTHTQRSHSLRLLLQPSFQADVSVWAAHGSCSRPDELRDSSFQAPSHLHNLVRSQLQSWGVQEGGGSGTATLRAPLSLPAPSPAEPPASAAIPPHTSTPSTPHSPGSAASPQPGQEEEEAATSSSGKPGAPQWQNLKVFPPTHSGVSLATAAAPRTCGKRWSVSGGQE